MAVPRHFNSYDALKVAALLLMTLDHLALFLWPEMAWLRVAGRAAAPCFLFLVGFNGQYRFSLWLLLAALVGVAADALLWEAHAPLNILWSILLGRLILQWMDARGGTHGLAACLAVLGMAALWLPVSQALVEMGSMALLWMLFGRAAAQRPGSGEAALYGLGAVAMSGLFTVYARADFGFDGTQALAGAAVYGVVALLLWRFRVVPLQGMPRVLGFWSRHALPYYVLHKIVLQAARLA